MNYVRKTVLALAAFALVGWLGYSAYQTYDAGQERAEAEVNYDAINTYLEQLES